MMPLENSHRASLNPELVESYRENPNFLDGRSRLESILRDVPKSFNIHANPTNLSGWSVLDLGCGSIRSSQEDGGGKSRDYEAWFPRVCALHNATEVIGVDLYPQDPKDLSLYTHIEANLIHLLKETQLIDLLKSKKFHLINSHATIKSTAPSKIFAKSMGEPRYNLEYGDFSDRFLKGTARMQENLKRQAVNLLHPKGILALNNELYVLGENNCLIPVPRE
jgi:hypothetical protein